MRWQYDFRVGSRAAGWFVAEDDGAELRQSVSFDTDAGERYEQSYAVRYRGSRVLAYRLGGAAWVDCSALPDDHYPTAAYPLVIRHGLERYVAIDEETGQTSPRTLHRDLGHLIEREGDTVVRTFTLRGDAIVSIDWGGATSTLTE